MIALATIAGFFLGSALPKLPGPRPSFGALPERCGPHMVRVDWVHWIRTSRDDYFVVVVVGVVIVHGLRRKVFWRFQAQSEGDFSRRPAVRRFCEPRRWQGEGPLSQVELE